MPRNLEVVARVVATDPLGRLLLTQRVGNDYWVPPGGRAHVGETLPQAARREAVEEVGAEVEVGPLCYVWEIWLRDRRRLECAFFGRVAGTVADGETEDRGAAGGRRRRRLVPLEDLPSLRIFPAALASPGYRQQVHRWAGGVGPERDPYLGAEGAVSRALPHRLNTRVVLVAADRLLLVSDDRETFWVLPGGLVEPEETLAEALARETAEETGLRVTAERLLYVREFGDEALGERGIECYFLGRIVGGRLRMGLDPSFADADRIRGTVARARWWDRAVVAGLFAYPSALQDRLWADLAGPGRDPYLGVARVR